MTCKAYFVDNILNKPKLICLYTVKWLQIFQSNTNNFNINHFLHTI